MAVVDLSVSETPRTVLPGLGRALVLAGKIGQQKAEDIYRKAQGARTSFIAELTGSGVVSAVDLAHTLSAAFSTPQLDLNEIDAQRLPKGLLDPRICLDYRVLVLGKRNNRLIVATADPSDSEAIEKIKFATQLRVDWVLAEYDKLLALVSSSNASASETIDSIIGDEFEFDESGSAELTEIDDLSLIHI